MGENPPIGKITLLTYFVVIHLLLILLIVKTDFVTRVEHFLDVMPRELSTNYYQLLEFQQRVDKNLPDKSVLFFGDSLVQGLAVSAISPYAVNFGIGNDTSLGVKKRIGLYRSIAKADAVVIAIGVNDLEWRGTDETIENLKDIIALIPQEINIVLSATHPVDETAVNGATRNNTKILTLNAGYIKLAQSYSNVSFVSIYDKLTDEQGNLAKRFHLGDGIHLNEDAYRIWISALRTEVNRINCCISGEE